MGKGSLFTALAVVAAIIGGVAGSRVGVPTDPAPATPVERTSAATIEVHVAGWVNSPGVVSLPEGSIVADAIDRAGGFRPGASADLINLASTLRSGDQIVVPGPGTNGGSGGHPAGLVVVNRATAADLEGLPGVGPVLAGRIVAFREANGPYATVEDLLAVPGIGESKLASIRDLIRVP